MSRRIAYVFAIAGCALFVVPASADRECFENTCRMPEVIETPDAPAVAAEQAVITDATRTAAPPPASPVPAHAAASVPPPAPIRPQMVVDQFPPPALKPLPFAPHEPVRQAKRQPTRQAETPKVRQADAPQEPVEVANRAYSTEQAYAAPSYVQPSANVIVVTPGYSYGDDGVVMAHKRNDPSWKLCQTERSRRDDTCSPYQYHAYGEHGYRPLGAYRVQRSAPAYVYIPDAKIVTIGD